MRKILKITIPIAIVGGFSLDYGFYLCGVICLIGGLK